MSHLYKDTIDIIVIPGFFGAIVFLVLYLIYFWVSKTKIKLNHIKFFLIASILIFFLATIVFYLIVFFLLVFVFPICVINLIYKEKNYTINSQYIKRKYNNIKKYIYERHN